MKARALLENIGGYACSTGVVLSVGGFAYSLGGREYDLAISSCIALAISAFGGITIQERREERERALEGNLVKTNN